MEHILFICTDSLSKYSDTMVVGHSLVRGFVVDITNLMRWSGVQDESKSHSPNTITYLPSQSEFQSCDDYYLSRHVRSEFAVFPSSVVSNRTEPLSSPSQHSMQEHCKRTAVDCHTTSTDGVHDTARYHSIRCFESMSLST